MISVPTVRRAADSDVSKIADLLGELGYSTHPSFILNRLQLVGGRPDDAVFVAESGGSVIGVVSVHVFPPFTPTRGSGGSPRSSSARTTAAKASANCC